MQSRKSHNTQLSLPRLSLVTPSSLTLCHPGVALSCDPGAIATGQAVEAGGKETWNEWIGSHHACATVCGPAWGGDLGDIAVARDRVPNAVRLHDCRQPVLSSWFPTPRLFRLSRPHPCPTMSFPAPPPPVRFVLQVKISLGLFFLYRWCMYVYARVVCVCMYMCACVYHCLGTR
ncbi:hypothetical protein LX36DRAFT_206818 [Colletotrichum falcatum]|nr:hypothetical protein LX36DRAFT_206818 [Colletotrichum falcatum]